MQTWIILALAWQLILALVAIFDKFLVHDKRVGSPFVFALLVTLLSGFGVVISLAGLLPLPEWMKFIFPSITAVVWPSPAQMGIVFLIGVANFFALYFLFFSVKKAHVSDVMPAVSAITSVVSIFLAWLIFHETLPAHAIWAFVFLIGGTAYISSFRFKNKVILAILASSLFFAINLIATKTLFTIFTFDSDPNSYTSFSSSFVWTRVAYMIVPILLIIFMKPFRDDVKSHPHRGKKLAGNFALVILNKTLGGMAALFNLKAVQIAANPAWVQSMSGLQYVLLFSFLISFRKFSAEHLGETFDRKDLFHKFTAITFIVIGFVLLFV